MIRRSAPSAARAEPLPRVGDDAASHGVAVQRRLGRSGLGHGTDGAERLGMRLGEATGATLALGVLKAAAACHNGMATFAEAGVSGPV
jgi:NaMN:DMB phosphoribosyltransferase